MFKQNIVMGPQSLDLFDPSKINDNILCLITLITATVIFIWTFAFGVCKKFIMGIRFA